MQTKFYVETAPDGARQFVRIKRAETEPLHHHHHRRRHRAHHGCVEVPVEEWNDLVRSEKHLRRENRSLKCSVESAMECAERERRRCLVLERDLERVEREKACLEVEYRRRRRGWEELRERYECARALAEEKAAELEMERNTTAMQRRMLRRHGIALC